MTARDLATDIIADIGRDDTDTADVDYWEKKIKQYAKRRCKEQRELCAERVDVDIYFPSEPTPDDKSIVYEIDKEAILSTTTPFEDTNKEDL